MNRTGWYDDKLDKPLEHQSQHGTMFKAKNWKLTGGVVITEKPSDDVMFAGDVAEFVAWHLSVCVPELNGFSGYNHFIMD